MIAVQKNNFGGQILYRIPGPVKKTTSLSFFQWYWRVWNVKSLWAVFFCRNVKNIRGDFL